jgi:hypothetical protein
MFCAVLIKKRTSSGFDISIYAWIYSFIRFSVLSKLPVLEGKKHRPLGQDPGPKILDPTGSTFMLDQRLFIVDCFN